MRKVLTGVVAALLLSVLGAVPADARAARPAQGDFVASVDFASLALRDAPGGRCVLTVTGRLVFTGTLVGEANGETTALVFAPCPAVGSTPPGTFFDLFRFRGTFVGTVSGATVRSSLRYAGVTMPGGAIDAVITLGRGRLAVLRAEAVVVQGGSYSGVVRR